MLLLGHLRVQNRVPLGPNNHPRYDHHVCDPVPELRIQFRNRGFETIPQDLSKPVTAFVARLGFRRDLHMSAEPAEPPGESLWLL